MNIPNNSFIRVENGAIVGVPFTLAQNYRHPDGTVTLNVAALSVSEKIAIGLYPVVEQLPASFDVRYQIATPVYTVRANDVLLTYNIANIPLADYKQMRKAEAYQKCADALNTQSAGAYSEAETSSWNALRREIEVYNTNNLTVGPEMLAVISYGYHTAASLSAALTPKIALYHAARQKRYDHVAAIEALTTHQQVADYQI